VVPADRGAAAAEGSANPGAAVLRPAWVEIDLDALSRNLRFLRRRVGDAQLLAVVKADAYGHGAVAVARVVEREGAAWLGVALVEEGAELRRAGIELPTLVLGTIQAGQVDEARAHRLTPAVSSLAELRSWAAAAEGAGGARLGVHLKVDTGMHRLGIGPAEWRAAADLLGSAPALRLDGVLSHLAESEVEGSELTARQEQRFADALAVFAPGHRRAAGAGAGPLIHLANSAAALHLPATRHSLVRSGLALYGIDPAAREHELRGVMSVKARLVQVREIEPGERVGYGGSWTAARPSRIGVAPLGYADGYPWRLGNRARASVDGVFVPVVGAVSMDMITLDLTGTDASVGSVVTLLAGGAAHGPTAVELAQHAGTVPYEILCHFGLRLPKRYLAGG
jgi:alanine racemase